MSHLNISPGQLSAVLSIISDIILVPIAAFILTCITAIIYNFAFAHGQSLRFGRARHPFDWARKLPTSSSSFVLLSLALFLNCTVSILPAIVENDFNPVFQRQNEDFSESKQAARFNLLSSFGSFVGDDKNATYTVLYSCDAVTEWNRTEYYALQHTKSGNITCLKGIDAYPRYKAAEYHFSTPEELDPIEKEFIDVRLTNYVERDLPTSESMMVSSGRVSESVGIFSLTVDTMDGRICEGAAVRMYTGNADRSAKVFGLCVFTGNREHANSVIQRVFLSYESQESFDDGSGTFDVTYTVRNNNVQVNNSVGLKRTTNHSVLASEAMYFYYLNGSRVSVTPDRLQRMVAFVKRNLISMSGKPGMSMFYFHRSFRVTPLSQHSFGVQRTGPLREYTDVGPFAVSAIYCMIGTLSVLFVIVTLTVWWLKTNLGMRLFMHTEQGLVLHVLSAIQQFKEHDVLQGVDDLVFEYQDGAGHVDISLRGSEIA